MSEDYHIYIILCPSSPHCNSSHPPQLHLKFMISSFLIIMVVCKHKYKSILCSSHVYVFRNNMGFFPGEDKTSASQQPLLIQYSNSSRDGNLWGFIHPHWCDNWWYHYSGLILSHCWDLMGAIPLIHKEQYLAGDSSHLSFIIFTPHLLKCSLCLKCGGCILDTFTGVQYPPQYYSLHFSK